MGGIYRQYANIYHQSCSSEHVLLKSSAFLRSSVSSDVRFFISSEIANLCGAKNLLNFASMIKKFIKSPPLAKVPSVI